MKIHRPFFCCGFIYYLILPVFPQSVNITEKSLHGPHVCVRLDKKSIPINVTKIETYYKLETSWCFAFPPRCQRKIIKKKLINSIEHVLRKKPVDYCCTGYKESKDHRCIPSCTPDCIEGYCVAPDVCKCKLGYSGPQCDTKCSNNMWGKDCTYKCTCKNGADCDSFNGHCTCTAGWTGEDCEIPCPEGTYGKQCRRQCDCKNGSICNHVTGNCKYNLNLTENTNKEEKATIETTIFTNNCKCLNGGSCVSDSNRCICPTGWSGEICDICSDGYWGKNCSDICFCYNGGSCHRDHGCICPPGYHGKECFEKCSPGTYGKNCSEKCFCKNGICSHTDGDCICSLGWTGTNCIDSICPDHFYGLDCSLKCNCENEYYFCHPLYGCSCFPENMNQCNKNELVEHVDSNERIWIALSVITAVLIICIVFIFYIIIIYIKRHRHDLFCCKSQKETADCNMAEQGNPDHNQNTVTTNSSDNTTPLMS